MLFLLSLFGPRQPTRHFALLDAQERCRALRQSRERPDHGNWIEVNETHISWLGHPIPAEARASAAARHTQNVRALTA